MDTGFRLFAIGSIVNRENDCRLEVDARYADAFLGLEDFSHIDVFYWLQANDTAAGRAVLRVHPRGDDANPLTGVFATRSPLRPNPLAVSRCRILSIAGTTITIDRIDARDGSPLIDIKCHIPPQDDTQAIRLPEWVANQ
jgi:tRNA-Thr(GGU) m(6)t(6)A37 methyltransferase TsaA